MHLTNEQTMIRDTARDFAQNRLLPNAADWDYNHHFPAQALQEMGELGMYGVLVPEAWGGVGADYVSLALMIEEIAAGDGAGSTILSVNNSLVCSILLKYGSDHLKSTYLRKTASGEMLGCFCLTEAHAGSDASAIRLAARREGDEYVLNGSKQFVTSGKNSDVAIVFAVTDAAAGKKGLSAFVVPTDNPGYQVSKVEEKLGQHASDTASIFFDHCRVPADHLIGQEGDGYKIALGNLEGGRIGVAAQSVGMARAAYEAALAYAKERESFGKPIIQHQAVGFRLADMATQLEAAHLMVMQAAQLKDNGEPCLKQACMAKLFASEMAEQVCSAAIQVHGGYGYLRDFPVERIYRDVRIAQIYEGTSDIQRLVIARELMNQGE